jgi:hypothetical protein
MQAYIDTATLCDSAHVSFPKWYQPEELMQIALGCKDGYPWSLLPKVSNPGHHTV